MTRYGTRWKEGRMDTYLRTAPSIRCSQAAGLVVMHRGRRRGGSRRRRRRGGGDMCTTGGECNCTTLNLREAIHYWTHDTLLDALFRGKKTSIDRCQYICTEALDLLEKGKQESVR
jgi:hypothetical protein